MARQVEDLGPYTKSVNDAAARVRGLWLGYIALLAYLFIAVLAVTHRDLLLENPVRLPILNVELPLVGFFFVAPGLLLINHFYLLLQLKGLSLRIKKFNEKISVSEADEEAKGCERLGLDTFVIVQMLAGIEEERRQLTGWFLKLIALITLVFAPVALLIVIQLQFLPYQQESVTWWHRITLGFDLLMLCSFWPAIKMGTWPTLKVSNLRAAAVYLIRSAAVLSILAFSWGIATFPGEFADGGPQGRQWTSAEDSYLSEQKQWLFGDQFSVGLGREMRRANFGFFRVLVLSDNKSLIDLEKFDRIKRRQKDNQDALEPWQSGRTLSLRHRNLRGATFNRSDLRNVDLFRANLQGASFDGANLRGASLYGAKLQGASLNLARLQGASLNLAGLQGSSLNGASLKGASLWWAESQGASLVRANLQGASLGNAKLEGASLNHAKLQGASLDNATLLGASLKETKLQGASLDHARLQGASFDGANLLGASLYGTNLQGASLKGANLQATSLTGVELWRTHGTPDTGEPPLAWIIEPNFDAVTPEHFSGLERIAIRAIEDEIVRNRVKANLAFLAMPETSTGNFLPPEYWNDLVGRVSEAEYQKHLAIHLQELACNRENGPYVAQGLIRESVFVGGKARLEHVGSTHLPQLAKRLLDAALGRSSDCAGAEGLNRASIAQLYKWAVETVGSTSSQSE